MKLELNVHQLNAIDWGHQLLGGDLLGSTDSNGFCQGVCVFFLKNIMATAEMWTGLELDIFGL